MTVIVKKEWLKEYSSGERLHGVHSYINWQSVYRYGWLLAVAFITVFFFVWQNVKIISSGYEIEKLKRHLNDIQSQNSLLTIEAASLEDLYVVEQRASYELAMTRPTPGQVVYIRYLQRDQRHGESQKPIPASGN